MNEKEKDVPELNDSPTLERKMKMQQMELNIKENMEKIKHKIAIISGKGGVGKTTVAANLAIKFADEGESAGSLDVDITGPNLHKLLGVRDRPLVDPMTKIIIPVDGPLNLKIMSMAFLLETEHTPVIWRGPMKMGVIREFLGSVKWGDLNYLVIDLPPGTGDETLDIMQLVKPIDGVVVVTTSQEMSLIDVAKTIIMSKKMEVPVLGLIENMSSYKCPHCGKEEQIYGEKGAAEKLARDMGVPFLGSIPLEPEFVQQTKENVPVILQKIDSQAKEAFENIYQNLKKQLK
ncbi:MAG: Mrp/NBP35 family ATP-binding protein [Candidatus Hodarchaeota archaeon]